MKPAPFEYYAPDSLDQVLDLMSQYAGEAKILAGGQSLVPAMNFRIVQPSVLIDLNRVAELSSVHEEDRLLRIGATGHGMGDEQPFGDEDEHLHGRPDPQRNPDGEKDDADDGGRPTEADPKHRWPE